MENIITGILNLVFFLFGFFIGCKTRSDDKGTNIPIKIEMPNLNPINAYKEHKEKREEERKNKELEINLHNIEVYDGTSNNQKEFK